MFRIMDFGLSLLFTIKMLRLELKITLLFAKSILHFPWTFMLGSFEYTWWWFLFLKIEISI